VLDPALESGFRLVPVACEGGIERHISSDVVQGAPFCLREPKLDVTARCSNPPSSDFDLDAFLTDARVTYY